MTIERQWIELMKLEFPDAFSPTIPFVPEVGFIDAQIKLMAMPHENSWDAFLFKQFVLPVQQMFRHGASKVILAFDDYANVPRAKSITQAKRIARFTPLPFGLHESLPPFPPVPWAAAMGNRAFKARVVELVATRIADMIQGGADKVLLVDWRGPTAQQWTFHADAAPTLVDLPRAPIGEADIKFRAVALEGRALAADAIDGDFVPIGLLAQGGAPLAVARLQIDAEVGTRAVEWVDLALLREGMRRVCPMRPLIALITLTGTDYSRNLPLLKPKKLWLMLRHVLPRLEECLDDEGVRVPQAVDRLVACIYTHLFPHHCGRDGDFDAVMGRLEASHLSNRFKQLLPSRGRAACTLKNANFLLRYWEGQSPSELAPFGFVTRPDGSVDWDETL
jgi:hypothetical protein